MILASLPGLDRRLGFEKRARVRFTARSIPFGLGFKVSSAAMGANAHEASGSGSATEIDRMMAELGLREEDLDDVVFDDKAAPPESTRWRAVARVHIDKPYSQ